jgi:opacity protein-like surface antigen
LAAPNVIAGWEADIQSSRLRGSVAGTSSVAAPGTIPFFTDTAVTSIVASRSLDWIGTIRGRLGGLVTPNLLLYATGGLAYGEVRSNATVTQTFALSPALAFFSPPVNVSGGAFGATRAGCTVGAGGEWMFLSHWSAKFEYLYYDLGSARYGTGISQFDAFGVLTKRRWNRCHQYDVSRPLRRQHRAGRRQLSLQLTADRSLRRRCRSASRNQPKAFDKPRRSLLPPHRG